MFKKKYHSHVWKPSFLFISLALFHLAFLNASSEFDFPVLYKGRYRSAEAYARLWLYDKYHAQTLKAVDFVAFHSNSSSPLTLLWSLDRVGYTHYQSAPLF